MTTTPRRLADIVLTAIRDDLGSDPFDLTICGDEVPARKPDPAPYRMAMEALGVLPAECVVIEDSHAGIAAGLAAGTAVLGVPRRSRSSRRRRASASATGSSGSARPSSPTCWPTPT